MIAAVVRTSRPFRSRAATLTVWWKHAIPGPQHEMECAAHLVLRISATRCFARTLSANGSKRLAACVAEQHYLALSLRLHAAEQTCSDALRLHYQSSFTGDQNSVHGQKRLRRFYSVIARSKRPSLIIGANHCVLT